MTKLSNFDVNLGRNLFTKITINKVQTSKREHKTIWYNKILNSKILKYYSIFEVISAPSRTSRAPMVESYSSKLEDWWPAVVLKNTTLLRSTGRPSIRRTVRDCISSHNLSLSKIEQNNNYNKICYCSHIKHIKIQKHLTIFRMEGRKVPLPVFLLQQT